MHKVNYLEILFFYLLQHVENSNNICLADIYTHTHTHTHIKFGHIQYSAYACICVIACFVLMHLSFLCSADFVNMALCLENTMCVFQSKT